MSDDKEMDDFVDAVNEQVFTHGPDSSLSTEIEKLARIVARHEIASLCALALQDPDVDTDAKSLAGFWLQRLGEDAA